MNNVAVKVEYVEVDEHGIDDEGDDDDKDTKTSSLTKPVEPPEASRGPPVPTSKVQDTFQFLMTDPDGKEVRDEGHPTPVRMRPVPLKIEHDVEVGVAIDEEDMDDEMMRDAKKARGEESPASERTRPHDVERGEPNDDEDMDDEMKKSPMGSVVAPPDTQSPILSKGQEVEKEPVTTLPGLMAMTTIPGGPTILLKRCASCQAPFCVICYDRSEIHKQKRLCKGCYENEAYSGDTF